MPLLIIGMVSMLRMTRKPAGKQQQPGWLTPRPCNGQCRAE
jgi:hypothetical protein